MRPQKQMKIEALLASDNLTELEEGLKLIKEKISQVGATEARPLLEMITSVFYIDTLERPDLAPILEEAITLLVGFGDWVIPVLIDQLDAGDIKAQIVISYALGRMGADVIEPLLNEYHNSNDPALQSFILYAMGKIKSPQISAAIEVGLVAMRSRDRELRDTATRAIGKFVESIPVGAIQDVALHEMIMNLRNNLGDNDSGIRAKAIRSMGKLAKYGHLQDNDLNALNDTLLLILGYDESFEWDRAYLVRKEAEEALVYVKGLL
ncbi:MAG: HEAT repeat domain-containing protein [bacterium]|nr:HEAT repeat domain-containing protein [bacterium]